MTTHGLTTLAPHPDASDPEPFAGPDHPIRQLTRRAALDQIWTAEDAQRMGTLFDEMAPEWSARSIDDTKAAPVKDALARGDVPLDGSWLEVGSGTGAGALVVASQVRSLVCNDLSLSMLKHAPDTAPRVQTDASRLPYADATFDAILMINMLLFPTEVDRVLANNGALVWVNTLGDQTPIHLPAADVLQALPGVWSGTTARAGTGFWLVARRA